MFYNSSICSLDHFSTLLPILFFSLLAKTVGESITKQFSSLINLTHLSVIQ